MTGKLFIEKEIIMNDLKEFCNCKKDVKSKIEEIVKNFEEKVGLEEAIEKLKKDFPNKYEELIRNYCYLGICNWKKEVFDKKRDVALSVLEKLENPKDFYLLFENVGEDRWKEIGEIVSELLVFYSKKTGEEQYIKWAIKSKKKERIKSLKKYMRKHHLHIQGYINI
ncbi:MAG: hypothetical protein NZ889_02365 [Candidatus Pacearchaeota archaeon]|nr:hypothetical protein [Candidatus Pacearchaeota archaeon]